MIAAKLGRLLFIIAGVAILAGSACRPASAHPVPKNTHDRKITVSLSKMDANTVKVSVHYRLEVDEYTVKARDMLSYLDEIDTSKYKDIRNAFYLEYLRIYSKRISANLETELNKQELKLACVKKSHHLQDEKGQALGHLRCDFVFEGQSKSDPKKKQSFKFRESNWELDPGKIDVTFEGGKDLHFTEIRQPDAELKKKTLSELAVGDDDKLRRILAVFALAAGNLQTGAQEKDKSPAPKSADSATKTGKSATTLESLLHEYRHMLWLLLILSALFGAAHALTPGHGKTLMAAYLVGENGTIFHALILGLVTTFTHTAVVLGLAFGLLFVPEQFILSALRIIQLGFGVLIAGIGFWLLTRRLSGRADHVHIGGSHHHHHGHDHHHHHGHHHHHDHNHHHDDHHEHAIKEHSHDQHHEHGIKEHTHQDHHDHSHADHEHDEQGNVIVKKSAPVLGWWGLIVMGMQGGIVPCWDAIALLCYAIATGLLAYALPMVLAFSAGLAGVLVVIGIAVVSSKKFAESRMGANRFIQMLPIASACIVIVLGIWLCYDGVHGNH